MNTIELTIAEAIQHLRSKGYDATPDKLREYEKRGLLGKIQRHAGYFRRYQMADLENIMRIMDFLALHCTMKQVGNAKSLQEKLGTLRGRLSQ